MEKPCFEDALRIAPAAFQRIEFPNLKNLPEVSA